MFIGKNQYVETIPAVKYLGVISDDGKSCLIVLNRAMKTHNFYYTINSTIF